MDQGKLSYTELQLCRGRIQIRFKISHSFEFILTKERIIQKNFFGMTAI